MSEVRAGEWEQLGQSTARVTEHAMPETITSAAESTSRYPAAVEEASAAY